MTEYNFKELKEGQKFTEDNGTTKLIITKNSAYDDYRLFDFKTSSGDSLASLAWIGVKLSTGDKILQPAIVTNMAGVTTYLSYDGRANYIGGSGSDLITMPSDGETYKISPPKPYYFNNDNPLVPNPNYSLNYNNKSIEMRNISIFKGDYSQGVMIELRASLEGSFYSTESGYVVIMLKVNTIK